MATQALWNKNSKNQNYINGNDVQMKYITDIPNIEDALSTITEWFLLFKLYLIIIIIVGILMAHIIKGNWN